MIKKIGGQDLGNNVMADLGESLRELSLLIWHNDYNKITHIRNTLEVSTHSLYGCVYISSRYHL